MITRNRKRINIIFVLLALSPYLFANETYVLDLKGKGKITLERQHYDGCSPFMYGCSPQEEDVHISGNHPCDSSNHIDLAYLHAAKTFSYSPDLDVLQYLQEVLSFATEYESNAPISLISYLHHPPRLNQTHQSIQSTILLV